MKRNPSVTIVRANPRGGRHYDRAHPGPSSSFPSGSDTVAYRGYLITLNNLHNMYYVTKDGHNITSGHHLADVKKQIDGLFADNPLHGRPITLAEFVRGGGKVYTIHDASGEAVGYIKAYDRVYAARKAKQMGRRLGRQVPVSHLATVATTLMDLDPPTRRSAQPEHGDVRRNPRPRVNPPATRVAMVLSTRVIDLSYLHAEAKRTPYRHKFNAGVTCQLLSDGSVRLFRPDGKPIWKNFKS